MGGDHAVGEPEFLEQIGYGVRACGEGFRAGVQDESRHLVGTHGAAEVVRGLDQGHAQTGARQVTGGRQPGDAAAHHESRARTPWRGAPLGTGGSCHRVSLWMKVTSSLSTSGSVSGGTPWPRLTT